MSVQEDRLKAIADAIREKEGSTEPIKASEFAARIRALEVKPEVPSRLPSGYLELKYIHGDTKASINTNYMINMQSKVCIDIKSDNFEELGFILSAYSSYANSGVYLKKNSKTTIYWMRGGLNNLAFTFPIDRILIEANVTTGKITLDSSTFSAKYTLTYTPTEPLFILCNPNFGDGMPCNIYSVQVYENDVLKRDLIPCMNESGELGLYDLVGEAFYPNVGEGTLTAGPAV